MEEKNNFDENKSEIKSESKAINDQETTLSANHNVCTSPYKPHSVKNVVIVATAIVAVILVGVFAVRGIFAHTHEFSEWEEIKSSTCTEEGLLERTCKCGEVQSKSSVKKEHSYGEWSTVENATCVKEGIKQALCNNCSDKKTEILSVVSHTYGESVVTKAATCTEKGVSEKTCNTCGDVKTEEIKADGHSYGEWSIKIDVTCNANGTKEKTCSKCKDAVTDIIVSEGHSFSSWITVKKATCTENGSMQQTCSKCGEVKTQAIKATGHNMSAATCTKAKTCNTCGKTEGSSLGHINVDGYCSRCGDKVEIDMNTVVGNPNDCDTTSYFGFCYYKNSADGIKVCWGGENLSGKTINYYTVTIYFYNSVGDPAYSEITGKSSKTIKYVGPVAPNEDIIVYGIVDYVPVCSKVVIGEITLEYSDGTSDTGWYGWSTTYKNSAIK